MVMGFWFLERCAHEDFGHIKRRDIPPVARRDDTLLRIDGGATELTLNGRSSMFLKSAKVGLVGVIGSNAKLAGAVST